MKNFNFSALDWMQRFAVVAMILVLPINGESADDDDAPVVDFKTAVLAERRLRMLEVQISQQTFDQMVFGQNQNDSQLRAKLGGFLSERIWTLDTRCNLSDDQQRKLLLAGRGDIKRIFDRIDELRNDYESPESTVQQRQRMAQNAIRLQSIVNSGYSVFGSESLLTKSIRHVLTEEQRSEYDELRLIRKAVPNTQPNRISFGSIRVGAIAEANCHITATATMNGIVDVHVNAPAFLQTIQKRVELQNGQGWRRPVISDVNLSLCTSTLGECEGTIQILIGDEWFAEIPVTATVVAPEPGLRRILMVESPFNGYAIDDASSLDAWRGFVHSAKLDASYLAARNGGPVFRNQDLAKYAVVIVGESGVLSMSEQDRARLSDYVNAGGRMIVTTNSEFRGSIAKVNQFLTRYGLWVEAKGVPSGRFDVVECFKMSDHPLTEDVGKLTFVGPSVVSLEDSTDGTILVNAHGIPDSGYAAIATVGKGSIVVLGSSACWNWIGGDNRNNSDNTVFLKNLICQP